MAFSLRQHATIPQWGTVANAIAPDPDDLAVAVPSVVPLSVATPDSQDFANLHVDWLYFADWLAAAIQMAVPHEPARAGRVEPTGDAVPIATDAPAAVVEPMTAIAAAVGYQYQAVVAVVGRLATTALVAEEDSAIDATVASETVVVVAVY